mmetsp:Transcript_4826/g.7730  ORF Transcript_4826/g.7730 Transcript_4826/m.7730 type:complete len:150 (+) Transcript_4826:797-1246(+)
MVQPPLKVARAWLRFTGLVPWRQHFAPDAVLLPNRQVHSSADSPHHKRQQRGRQPLLGPWLTALLPALSRCTSAQLPIKQELARNADSQLPRKRHHAAKQETKPLPSAQPNLSRRAQPQHRAPSPNFHPAAKNLSKFSAGKSPNPQLNA